MSKWSKIRNQHPNSISAYYEGKLSGLFSKRETEIIAVLRRLGSATDRQIMNALGYVDPNKTRPRINELITEADVLEECGKVYDDETKQPVRIVRIRKNESVSQGQLF